MGEQQLAVGGEFLRHVGGGGIGQIEIAGRSLRCTCSIRRIVTTGLRARVIKGDSADHARSRQIPELLDVLRVVDHDAAVGGPGGDADGGGRNRRDRVGSVVVAVVDRCTDVGGPHRISPDIGVRHVDARHHLGARRGVVRAADAHARLGHGLALLWDEGLGRGRVGVREGDAGGGGSRPGGGKQSLAAVRMRGRTDLAGRGAGRHVLRRRRLVAAVALPNLAGLHLQPHALRGSDAARVGVQHAHAEGDVRRHLDLHRAVGLDGRIAQDLEHVVARAEGGRGEIHDGAVGDRDRLLQADEARRPLTRRRLGGIGDGRDVGVGGVHPVDVVDTSYIDDAYPGVHQVLIEVHPRHLVENDGGKRVRLRHGHVRDHDALDRRHQRHQGVLHRIEHPHTVERRRRLHVRLGERVRGARHDRRRGLGVVDQPALTPADQDAVGAVLERVARIEAPARGGPGDGLHGVGGGGRLRRSRERGVGGQRLGVLGVVRAVDDDEVAAEVDAGVLALEREDAAVLHLPWLHELDHRVVGTGHVAVGAVVELEIRAVGIGRVQVHGVLAGRVIPAAPQHAAVREHGGVAVVALVEGDLVHAGAVGVHDLEHEGRFVPILVLSFELGLALIEQDPLRLGLARG